MHPQLQAILDEFDAASERLRMLAITVPAERWAERPASDSWSPAECIAHLNLTAKGFLPDLREAVEQARTLGGGAPAKYSRGLVGGLLYRVTGPDQGMKVKTAASFVPGAAAPAAELIAEFERLQVEQMELVRQAQGLPIHRVKVASPFNPRVKYNAYAALTVLPHHQLRHLLQAERAWAAVSGA